MHVGDHDMEIYLSPIKCTAQTHACCNCSEALLTSCIPDLQFNPFSIKLNGSYLEVNSVNRGVNKINREVQPRSIIIYKSDSNKYRSF